MRLNLDAEGRVLLLYSLGAIIISAPHLKFHHLVSSLMWLRSSMSDSSVVLAGATGAAGTHKCYAVSNNNRFIDLISIFELEEK